MAVIHSLKCTMPFSFVVPLLSLALTMKLLTLASWSHLFPFVVTFVLTRCITRCHPLSLVVQLVVIRCHSLSLVVPLFVTRCDSLSFVVTRCTTHCHSLSLVVTRCTTRLSFYKWSRKSEEDITIKFCKSYEGQKQSFADVLQNKCS